MMNVENIRNMFKSTEPDSNGMIEIINASFIADEPAIFGTVDKDYVRREIEWYMSRSLNIYDMRGNIPSIWKQVSDELGFINSNYGWCVFSVDNGLQFSKAVEALADDPNTRRSVCIYNRPSMHDDYNMDGMNDFICTMNTQHFIRGNQLYYLVYMRSNDAIFGYKNDFAWHYYVQRHMLKILRDSAYPDLEMGPILWNAGSLHIYPRHHHLIKEDK